MCQKLEEAAPKSANVQIHLAECFCCATKQADRDLKRAFHHAERAVALSNGDNPWALVYLANCYARMGQAEKAASTVRRASSLKRGDVIASPNFLLRLEKSFANGGVMEIDLNGRLNSR